MAGETTGDLIQRSALKLFSEKGYSAVSMRDLAEAAGISVSTIYHYYKSKEMLFREMIRQADALAAEGRDAFFRALDHTEKVECEPFVRAGMLFVTAYLRNPGIDPLLKMLESERAHDPAAEEAWQRMLFADPMAHEEKVFDLLIARGEIRNKNAAGLAGEYHGIVLLGYFTGDTDRMANALKAFYERVFDPSGGNVQ